MSMDLIRKIGHAYTTYTPRMKILNGLPRDKFFQICVWVVSQVYSETPAEYFPVSDIWPEDTREYIKLEGFVPESHVVYAFGDEAFIGFRGINPAVNEDIKKCVHIINNDLPEDPELLEFCNEIQRKYPRTYLTGHSYGGLKASWLSRTMASHPPAILLNPAQGFDPAYPARFDTQPQITTYRIYGDFVSRLAGLENPDGIHIIKLPEGMDRHGIKTFATVLEVGPKSSD